MSTENNLDLSSYSRVVVAFSGGKDSLACLVHLLDRGVARDRIELWHHDIDGREGSKLMDWPVTADYCRKVAGAFGVPIYFSWKQGGFEGEMGRDNSPTQQTWFETPDGLRSAGGKGGPGTRGKFPQVSANLSVRWCSAYLKIDVMAIAIRNQPRFKGQRTLVVTGERAEESSARAKYAALEPHRAHGAGRHIDQWRPIHQWTEQQVWAALERWRVNPHPAYKLGWGRLSCAACIFGSNDQWASLAAVAPAQAAAVSAREAQTGLTIKRHQSVSESAQRGTCYPAAMADTHNRELSQAATYTDPVFATQWELPAGAYGDSTGPT